MNQDLIQLTELINLMVKAFGLISVVASAGVVILIWRLNSVFVSKKEYKEDMQGMKDEIKQHAVQIAQQETNVRIVSNKIDALEKNIEVIVKSTSELLRKDILSFSELFKKDFDSVKADIQHMNGNLKQYSNNQTGMMERIAHLEPK